MNETACKSCQRALFKAGSERCLTWKKYQVARCSEYAGPFAEFYEKLKYGKEYVQGIYRKK
jgi:hypothetical protein